MANHDKRIIPYGLDLNSIPKEDPNCKALIPISNAQPLAAIPPKPHSYSQSYFAQPVLTAPPQPLLLEDKLSKEPVVKLPTGTKLLPPKHNETLVGVKTNKKGEIVCAKYSTGKHTYFEGVRSHPSKVKFLPPEEAPKHALAKAEAPRKRRKTLADLEKLIEAQQATISSIESTLRLQNRCFLRMHKKVEDIEKNNKELEKRVSALEPPKPKK
jgi:hypothetical protein